MDVWGTFYKIQYSTGLKDPDKFSMIRMHRGIWHNYHLTHAFSIDDWFEIEEEIINPFEKTISGTILGRQFKGNASSEEVLYFIKNLTRQVSDNPKLVRILIDIA